MPGTYSFRLHADYGRGAFVGIDGAEFTPGDIYTHIQTAPQSLGAGDHEFEALVSCGLCLPQRARLTRALANRALRTAATASPTWRCTCRATRPPLPGASSPAARLTVCSAGPCSRRSARPRTTRARTRWARAVATARGAEARRVEPAEHKVATMHSLCARLIASPAAPTPPPSPGAGRCTLGCFGATAGGTGRARASRSAPSGSARA